VGSRVLTSLLIAAGAAHADPAGRIIGKVSVSEADGTTVANVDAIVYVVGFKETPDPAAPKQRIAQKDRKFVPDLVAITAGETITFPNEDSFLHNVFSQSAARRFDLGSYKKGDPKDKDFPEPGVVDVYCNIHPEMAATILVLPNRHHARTDATGAFKLDGVPPGDWTVFAFTRRATKPVSAKVTVKAGADTSVDLALARGAEGDHKNKYGEKYKDGAQTTYH
jgi:plastocyanin